LAAALLYFVISRSGGERILRALLSANPVWAAASAFCFLLSIFVGALQWHMLLRLQGIEYGFFPSFRSYYAGLFLNNFMPGTVGGDALRVWDVHRSEAAHGVGKAAAATLIDRLLGFSALAFFSLLALGYELQRNSLPNGLIRQLLLAVGAVFICFVLLFVFLLSKRISNALHGAIRMLGWEKLDTAYAKVQDALFAYKKRQRTLLPVFIVACLVQLLRVGVHALCAFALHLTIAPSFFFSFIPLIALAAVLPLNVGGWGIPQGLGAYLYALPGILSPDAVSGPFEVSSAAAALAFLPSAVGMVVMLWGGFYFVSGRPRKPKTP